MTVCSCHVTYTFQSESTLYSCLNVKELLARSSCQIWSLKDCNWTWTQNHLVDKQTLNHLAKWLSVRLRAKWFWIQVQLQLLKTIMEAFLHYLKINSPPNKVIQTKKFVYYVLLKHLFFQQQFEIKTPLKAACLLVWYIFWETLHILLYLSLTRMLDNM